MFVKSQFSINILQSEKMKAKCLCFALLVFCGLPFKGQASALVFDGDQRPGFEISDENLERFAAKAYRFVSARIPDGADRVANPIHLRFSELPNGMHGFTPSRQVEDHTIYISSKLVRSHVDFQITLVHELTHLLRHTHQPDEELWLDEGLAHLMEVLYSGDWPMIFEKRLKAMKTVALTNDLAAYNGSGDDGGDGYVTSFFAVLYLYNHLGADRFLAEVGSSKAIGWDNVIHAARELKKRGTIGIAIELLTPDTLWRHFTRAVQVNDPFAADYALLLLDRRF